MANYNKECFQTKVAGADLSSDQFKFVKLNASGEAILASAAGELCYGVLFNKPLEDDPATIFPVGSTEKCKVLLGENVVVGSPLATSSAGLAVLADTTADVILGYALEVASSGEVAEFTPAPAGRLVPA